MKILIVLTSHSQLGNTGHKTGFWVEEFAAPYYILKDAGATIVLASPKGGQPPIDPKSAEPVNQTEATDEPLALANVLLMLPKAGSPSPLTSNANGLRTASNQPRTARQT